MLERFKLLIRLEEKDSAVKKAVKHIAVTTDGIDVWSEKNKKNLYDSYKRSFEIIKKIIAEVIKRNIPILTIYILPESAKRDESFSQFLDELVIFLNDLKSCGIIHENKVKVSALGKWYDIPSRVVDSIKAIIDDTRDYDSFFVNLCINYDGQEEIVDACKLIARQVVSGKIEIDSINQDTIKENCYSSYFLPPNVIVKNGHQFKNSLMLWDSVYSELFFTGKLFPDFTLADLAKAIEAAR